MSGDVVKLDFGPTFQTASERLTGERPRRLDEAQGGLSFGVHFLNMALGSIARRDLILIGAKTGLGKTELCSLIAIANANRGKHVHYFALEAEKDEIERRAKFKLLCQMVGGAVHRMNFLDWMDGKLEDICEQHDAFAERKLCELYGNRLHTLYRTGDFTVSDLEKQILAIQDETDLIIVDHLHYLDSEDDNENRGYRAIVKRIRDVALSIAKPVIVVAHVRKSNPRYAPLVPTLEDFMGTSDIPKIATKAIMLAPAYDQPNEHSWLWNTYIAIHKCRRDGQRTRYVGLVEFNARIGAYERSFQLGKLINNGEEWKPIDGREVPAWATEKPREPQS